MIRGNCKMTMGSWFWGLNFARPFHGAFLFIALHFYPFLASKIYPSHSTLFEIWFLVDIHTSLPTHPSRLSPCVLGGFQVQDPGGGPGHGAKDHEDPNLEADAEEGVGLGSMAGSMSCHADWIHRWRMMMRQDLGWNLKIESEDRIWIWWIWWNLGINWRSHWFLFISV